MNHALVDVVQRLLGDFLWRNASLKCDQSSFQLILPSSTLSDVLTSRSYIFTSALSVVVNVSLCLCRFVAYDPLTNFLVVPSTQRTELMAANFDCALAILNLSYDLGACCFVSCLVHSLAPSPPCCCPTTRGYHGRLRPASQWLHHFGGGPQRHL